MPSMSWALALPQQPCAPAVAADRVLGFILRVPLTSEQALRSTVADTLSMALHPSSDAIAVVMLKTLS